MTNPVQIEVSPTFQENIRSLAKKYRNIRQDLQPVINQLEQGELLGDQISGIGYPVFKLRVKNSDIQKGKSGGYRLIYYLKTSTGIVLLTIYPKSEQSDIEADEIRDIITEYQQQS
ncbi:MAG: type II toxin-antitoxin system RelE/ParE family toxin [Pseudanabaena sp. ELA607]